jgi:hypothetical protein
MKVFKTKTITNFYKYSLAILMISLILSSCSKESNPIIYQGKNDEIYPLAEGNKWEYSRTAYDIDNNIIAKDTISTELDMSYLKNGVEWFGIKFSWYQISKQSDGIWSQYTQAPDEPIPSLMYKYPTYSGDSYPYWNVISTQKIIKIDLGYFRTIHYRYLKNSETKEYDDYFLCPGIGLIKYNRVRRDSSGKYYIEIEEELIKYKVN